MDASDEPTSSVSDNELIEEAFEHERKRNEVSPKKKERIANDRKRHWREEVAQSLALAKREYGLKAI